MNTADRINSGPRWEYLVYQVDAIDGWFDAPGSWWDKYQRELNSKGKEGWELVSLEGGSRVTFKRPKATYPTRTS